MKSPVLFIVGPTGVGKSRVALLLAKDLNAEIVSADSMQVYRGMDIGTAKPTPAEQKKIAHHLLNLVAPSELFSVFEYRQMALSVLKEVTSRGKLPIVVGGSGLYVRALLEGLSEHPGGDIGVREKLIAEACERGVEVLYERLQKLDSKRAAEIKPADQRRIIRALEVIEQSGTLASAWHGKRETLKDLGYTPIVIGITKDREALCRDIEARVEEMFRRGWVEEVKRSAGGPFSKTSSQAVGYKEILEFLNGVRDLQMTKDLIKQRTRQLAKRQRTWFKREKGIRWIDWQAEDTAQVVCERILQESGLSELKLRKGK